MADHAKEVDVDEEEEDFFFFPDDGGRPLIDPYKHVYKFTPGDKVYICAWRECKRRGPYLIEAAEDGKYRLCDTAFKTIDGGKTFEQRELERLQ